ncbi:MAG: hypothetical protein JNM68_09200 [Dinghuibacter sp.]|nr:hypothetical protein [Dinghuibacter sp.]
MNRFFCSAFSSFILLLAPALLNAQASVFLEPNIAVAYDSTLFKLEKRYGANACDFSLAGNTSETLNIHILAEQINGPVSIKNRNRALLQAVAGAAQLRGDSLTVTELNKQVRTINGFSFAGIVLYNKREKKYAAIVTGYQVAGAYNTTVNYYSNARSLNQAYATLTTFLKGVKTYSREEIGKENQLIRNQYTVVVTPSQAVAEHFPYRPHTFLGIVSVKEPLQHKIAGVRLEIQSFSKELFSPLENGTVPIRANDAEKGTIEKKGVLVILNSFGKEVLLPFSFSYNNP